MNRAAPAGKDARARAIAVDPGRSVIVQAPAGSGKTTLLVERYLGLLASVHAPEEILAITFTRKAAAQMRRQVLDYLAMQEEPAEEYRKPAWRKARKVQDRVGEWGVLENPARLHIRTIDSFSAFLVRHMPVLSRLGPVPSLDADAWAAYRIAARRTLDSTDRRLAPRLRVLLEWRDNNRHELEDLIARLLPVREKWLRVLGMREIPIRADLESALAELVERELDSTRAALLEALEAAGSGPGELVGLACHARARLLELGRDNDLTRCERLKRFPAADPESLDIWRAVACLLLTGKGELRKSVNINTGFAPKTPEKAHFEQLLEGLAGRAETFAGRLRDAGRLPEPAYREDQWHTLEALVHVLRHSAAELEVVFAETGRMDFTGMSAAALRALGEDDAPTDLELYLDHRIRHILVDEFQDTNWSQYKLLRRLTAGWTGQDGRTLFLVGDPMQSIYRFREAEVGLFVRVRDHGLGELDLESVRLTRNFRSLGRVVGWVNDCVGPAFPANDDIGAGAVRYSPSEAARGDGGDVVVIAGVDRDGAGEAAELADRIQTALSREPADYRIAVLVRSRNHLRDLLPELRARGIHYRSLKLERLIERPVVQDLIALTRAVWHPADRASALAVLRAPCCGLTLADLLALVDGAGDVSISHLLGDDLRLAELSGDGRERARRAGEVFTRARLQARRRPLRDLVEGAWIALGGPEVCREEVDLGDARDFLDHLSAFEESGDIRDWSAFEEYLDDKRATGAGPAARVEVLTVHEAKGLEWDMVVLPSLERTTGQQSRELLYWLDHVDPAGQQQLLLAPLRAAWEKDSGPLVGLIGTIATAMEANERKRLLYVAATRARHSLVVSASARSREGELADPQADSMLADLWPALKRNFAGAETTGPAHGKDDRAAVMPDQRLRRITASWRPVTPPAMDWSPQYPPRERVTRIEYDWAGLHARSTGTVMHRLLEWIGKAGIEDIDADWMEGLRGRIPLLLRHHGVDPERVDAMAAQIEQALEQVLADERGRWILSGRHRDAASELAIGGVIDGRLVHAVVDRTFVDSSGVRWIIDYKSGRHEGGSLEEFKAREAARYSEQLDTYSRLFRQMGERDVRAALYLPMHAAWMEPDAV